MSLIDNLTLYAKKQRLSPRKKMLLDSFIKKGFPTVKEENWKYTSLKKIIAADYVLDSKNISFDNSKVEEHSLNLKYQIIFCDGKMLSFPKINGVKISSFSDFECQNDDSTNELNAALANYGYTISVDKNTIVESPVEILFFNTTKNSFIQYRNQMQIGDNSEIKIVEKIQDLSHSLNFANNFTRIVCGKNSNVEYNKIQTNTEDSKLIDFMRVFQEQNSTCNINTLIFGGGFIRNNLNFEQNGSNCESNMNGISLLDKNQFADNHTFVDHKTANCRSNEMYKGIYLGESKGVFNGKIMVRKNAQKIDAFQSNNNLLLSDNSTIDSKPQLEIYADDVKCSHGCTIGQLDENALFYLRSRGIRHDEAKAILTYTFASEAIENLSIDKLKNLCQILLAKKLNVDINLNL